MFKEYSHYLVKRHEYATWYEKAILYFLPYKTHESEEGFVIYKLIFNRFYVYISGQYIYEKKQSPIDPGFDRPWSN